MRRPALLTLVLVTPVVPFGVAAFQVPEIGDVTPGWLTAAFVGAWVVLWLLDRIGKLPGGSQFDTPRVMVVEPDKLKELLADPNQVAKIHEVVTREDSDKPGYYMVWSTGKERRALERTMDDHGKLMHATIETLEAMKRSMASLHAKIDELNDRRSA